MTVEVVPPDRVGPVAVGMSMTQAEEVLRFDGAEAVGEPDGLQRGVANYASGLTIHVHPGGGDAVNAVEAFRPLRPVPVRYNGIDLLGSPASEVLRQLEERTVLEVEEGGCSVTVPQLMLALWRPFVTDVPEDVEGYYFQSVLVAQPGYYD